MLKIAIGCDHIVTDVKDGIRDWLIDLGYEVIDCGTYDYERTHYPIYGKKVSELVATGIVDRGITICGTAVGISNAAQKYYGTRVVLAGDVLAAKTARTDYDANILAFGGRIVGRGLAEDMVTTFLTTDYVDSEKNNANVKLINSLIKKPNDKHTFKKYIELWNEGYYHD